MGKDIISILQMSEPTEITHKCYSFRCLKCNSKAQRNTHLEHIMLMNDAYEYALEYIDKYMIGRKCDPVVIVGIILQMIRTTEDLESIDNTGPREIIGQQYEAFVKEFSQTDINVDLCFDILCEKNPKFCDLSTVDKISIYNDAFQSLLQSDPEVYETSVYPQISNKIDSIIQKLALQFLSKIPKDTLTKLGYD